MSLARYNPCDEGSLTHIEGPPLAHFALKTQAPFVALEYHQARKRQVLSGSTSHCLDGRRGGARGI
jgi:hypothetical protein